MVAGAALLALAVLPASCGTDERLGASTEQQEPTPIPVAVAAAPDFSATTLLDLLRQMAEYYAGSPGCSDRLGSKSLQVCRLWALQQMLTSTAAADGVVGGAFQLPYFWHWVEPNPRLQIVHLPEEVPLSHLPPPPGYERYRTFGHVDRTPLLFLGDLAMDEPCYTHPEVGRFLSFGWCSEREMAFCALATAWGYQAKIEQRGIHVKSRVWLEGTGVEVVLDSTFDSVSLACAAPPLSSWREDVGEGRMVRWYNRVCHDEDQLQQLGKLPISAVARQRLAERAAAYFARFGS